MRFEGKLVPAHVPASLSFDLLDADTQEPVTGPMTCRYCSSSRRAPGNNGGGPKKNTPDTM